MITNLNFSAEPVDPVKVDMDLQIPENLVFKFTISGQCDKRVLKKLVRIIKFESKNGKPEGNKT